MSELSRDKGCSENQAESQITPDYKGWESLREWKGSIRSLLDFLKPRSLCEILMLFAMVELYLIAKDINSSASSDAFTPLRAGCVMACAVMIAGLALTVYFTSTRKDRFNGETIERRKKASES